MGIKKAYDKRGETLVKISTTRLLKPLFPTTVEIIGNHIVVIYRQLFSSQRIEIAFQDIYNVEVDAVFEFAELIIYSKMFVDNTIKIPKLWKWQAEEFQATINKMRQEERDKETTVFTPNN